MAGTSGWDAEWRHHDLSNPALAAVSIYALEAAASLIHHNGDVDAVALAAAAAAGVATWAADRHFWHQIYLTVATVVSLAWVLYAEHFSPFTARSLTAFGIAAVALGPLYLLFARAGRRDKRKADERMNALLRRKAERGDWLALFASLGVRDVTQVGGAIETRGGQSLTFRLPSSGKATFGRVAVLSAQIETALDLPPGSVRFRQVAGEGAATFHVDLVVRDVLAEEVPLPDDFAPRSVNDPFTLGMDEFGEDIDVLMRELSTMIFAPKGSGKSNLLNVFIAMLARCVDVVIWVIDLKGGRFVRPWLTPWFEGRTDRPIVDWVATDLDEAQLMLTAASTAIDYRSSTGEGEKITPSPSQPAIFLIVDEGANLTGLRVGGGVKRSGDVFDIIGRGRSEAVDTIMAFLRATVSLTGSGDLKSQSQLRITLGAASAADATSALDNPGMGRAVAAFKHPGSMLLQRGQSDQVVGKTSRVEPDDIPAIAQACSPWRPGLEEELEEVLGDAYATRWSIERSGHLLPVARQKELGIFNGGKKPAATASGATATVVTPRPVATLPTIPPPPKDAKPAYRTVDGRPIPRKLSEADVNEMFAGLRADLADIERNAPHRGRTRMLGLIAAAGREGIKPGELTDKLNGEGIDCVRQTVQEWLRDEVGRGRIVNRGNGIYVTKEND
jgi:hypothetical protein